VPELPDLEYIVSRLSPRIVGRFIASVTVKDPLVLRYALAEPGGFAERLRDRRIMSLRRRGPFLDFGLDAGLRLIVHCMLTGRLQIAEADGKPLGFLCLELGLDDGRALRYGDEKRMGKVYLAADGRFESIPGFREQGVPILSEDFTRERFEALIEDRRDQARVFLMDQSALSAIGNAYADEILFAAGIHPKAFCNTLTADQRGRLYESIRSVMTWAIAEIEKAAEPIEVKVRGHVRVRGRKDEPCPVCGATIRRLGVRGYDAYFCPTCQALEGPGADGASGNRAANARHQIPWKQGEGKGR
jgi:formamidopyrimidine-DNA glycosylase